MWFIKVFYNPPAKRGHFVIVQSNKFLVCFAKGPSKDYKAILKGVKIYKTYWIAAAFTEL